MPRPQEPDAHRPPDRGTPAARPWVKPVLVEYGHLAKLTRGPSGAVTEQGTYKKKCL